jgi:hypothetical protein
MKKNETWNTAAVDSWICSTNEAGNPFLTSFGTGKRHVVKIFLENNAARLNYAGL